MIKKIIIKATATFDNTDTKNDVRINSIGKKTHPAKMRCSMLIISISLFCGLFTV